MANKQGTNQIVDSYIGDKLIEARYVGQTKYFDPYTTLTGTLPLSFNSRVAGALKNYRLYGDSDGSGVQTENLFDKSTALTGYLATLNNGMLPISSYTCSDYIPVAEGEVYTAVNVIAGRIQFAAVYYNSNKTPISNQTTSGSGSSLIVTGTLTVPSGATYMRINMPNNDNNVDTVMLVKGSTAPTSYIPYGYKIPISLTDGTSTSNYDLFIGDTKLGATEYLDFSEQKIYKDVAGTLTPTDPPVAFPAITTYLGENTLSSTETVGNVMVKGRISEITS